MKPNPFVSLFQSRKSWVGAIALVLVGLVYFFGHGDETARSVAMGTIAAIASAIITAIGKEDAAEKSATVVVGGETSEPEKFQ